MTVVYAILRVINGKLVYQTETERPPEYQPQLSDDLRKMSWTATWKPKTKVEKNYV